MLTRRQFFQSALAGMTFSVLPGWMPRLAFAPKNTPVRGDVLVCIFLRGAADALNIVVPHGESEYYRLRPTLNIPRPDATGVPADGRALDLDGFFGLHPMLAPLLPAWQERRLAFVHACGAPDESRSHFQAMELMERGVEAPGGPASGWIGRHLASLDTGNHSPLRAIGLGDHVQRSLQGTIPVSALRSIADFHLKGDPRAVAEMQETLALLYANDSALGEQGADTLELLQILEKLDAATAGVSGGAVYPDSELGMALKQIALLIKAQVGLEVACVDVGGWDTHIAQGSSRGNMAELLRDLAQGLAAFQEDLYAHANEYLIVTMSEFGRRVYENGGLGTDHGHGSVMWLLGQGARGGKVHGAWPGLNAEQLFQGGDLAVTTDYRNVLGEVVSKRLKNPKVADVFPNFAYVAPGVLR